MTSRTIAFVLLGTAFGTLLLCFGEDPSTWFSMSLVAFLASVLLTVFEEDRSVVVIVGALLYAAAASWVFYNEFIAT